MIQKIVSSFNIIIPVAGSIFAVIVLRRLRFAGPLRDELPNSRLQWSGMLTIIILGSTGHWLGLFSDTEIISLRDGLLTLGPSLLLVSLLFTVILLFESPMLHRKFGKVWIKALDFPYIMLAAFGLARTLGSSRLVSDTSPLFDKLAFFCIGLAISIRLTKATIEVFFDNWYNY